MHNHARTLLLNIAATTARSIPGQEYIDPDYRPITLTGATKSLHAIIFGQKPEQYYSYQRAYEAIRMLYSTEYSEYVDALDSRHSYALNDSPFSIDSYGVTKSPDASIDVYGTDSAIDSLGVAYKTWTMSLSSSTLTIRSYASGSTTQQELTFTGDVSNPISLPDSALKARVKTTGGVSSWRVASYNRPGKSWGDILAEVETKGLASELFGLQAEEPWLTFYGLWKSSQLINYRVAGLLLAYIYRVEEARDGV
jgi:hypothetical protein